MFGGTRTDAPEHLLGNDPGVRTRVPPLPRLSDAVRASATAYLRRKHRLSSADSGVRRADAAVDSYRWRSPGTSRSLPPGRRSLEAGHRRLDHAGCNPRVDPPDTEPAENPRNRWARSQPGRIHRGPSRFDS